VKEASKALVVIADYKDLREKLVFVVNPVTMEFKARWVPLGFKVNGVLTEQ